MKSFEFTELGGYGFPATATANRKSSLGDGAFGWPALGYDATRHTGKRKTPAARVLSEDQELRQLPRRQLITSVRDLNRNFAAPAFAIRRHLDYVSTFHFRSKTGIRELDIDINNWMRWWSLPANCDSAGRHSLPRLVRMMEMRRTIDGDVLINRLADGRIQLIEGDRIQTFGGIPYADLGIEDPRWVIGGVWVNENGRANSYMVFRRPPWLAGLLWDRAIPAKFADLFGYFDRVDQVRGISPVAAAANTFRDLYEGFDYALVKLKVAQFLAVLFTRGGSESLGITETREGETDPKADPDKPRYDMDMNRSPVALDMDQGDDARIIESQQPSNEMQQFSKMMIMVALKSLDIPLSFFDESFANYSGSQLAKVQYVESAKPKQADVRMMLDKITRWRLGLAVADGDIELPANMNATALKWEWTHAGIPIYDEVKDTTAAIARINAGLSSAIREAKKLGLDVFELIDETAEVQDYAAAARGGKGVILSTALPANALDDPNKTTTKTEGLNEEADAKTGQANIWGDRL